MFRVVSERLCWWPVTFPGVTEEGDVVENKIELRFKVLDEDEFPDFLKRLTAPATQEEDAQRQPETARVAPLLLEVVRDWRLVAAANGEALTFTPDSFRTLIKTPNLGSAIGRAYIACRNATPEVREGN